jgi:hypothetical protein
MLIYQQVPAPFGVTGIKPWLHYAVWVTGALLLAQYLRNGTQAAQALTRRMGAKLQELKRGFEFKFNPARGKSDPGDDRGIGDDGDLLTAATSTAKRPTRAD